MLLLELTVDGQIVRCSNQDLSLENPWDHYVISFGSLRVGISQLWGGLAVPDYGSVEFSPDLALPVTVACRVLFTLTTEAEAQLLVEGTLYRNSISRKRNIYNLYVPDRAAVSVSDVALNDSLVNVISWACDSSRLNLTVDTSLARSPSPAVLYTTGTDVDLLDLIEDMAAFYHHWIRIDEQSSTLSLIDMEQATASRSLDRLDHLPSTYSWQPPVRRVSSNGDPSHSVAGLAYGISDTTVTSYDSSQVGTEAALGDILTCLQAGRCELRMGMDNAPPVLGEEISWVDSRIERPVTASIKVHSMIYNFDNRTFVAEGWGEVTQ